MFVLAEFLPYRFDRIAGALSVRTRAVYRRYHDMTTPEWRVLASLAGGETMTSRQIGLRTAMHKTKVSRAVQALEGRRWLTRTVNEQNRREAFCALTPLGRRSFDEILPHVRQLEADLLARLGTHKDELLALLDRSERALVSVGAGRRP